MCQYTLISSLPLCPVICILSQVVRDASGEIVTITLFGAFLPKGRGHNNDLITTRIKGKM